MRKCDFCKASKPNGECFWDDLQGSREADCEKAIKLMVEALKEEKVAHKNKKKIIPAKSNILK